MVKLTRAALIDEQWQRLGIDVSVARNLEERISYNQFNPQWLHIAPSNLFAAEIAPIAQDLGLGIIGLETLDSENVDRIYKPHDNLRLRVVMPPKGENLLSVIGSIVDVRFADPSRQVDWYSALTYAAHQSVQLISVTCTEKGYSIENDLVDQDKQSGPEKPQHVMSKIAAMLYHRLISSGDPLAVVSMDNCSQNGRRLQEAVLDIARAWNNAGLVDRSSDFPQYVQTAVSFPWTMIDRITPRPSQKVLDSLVAMGIEDMDIIETAQHTVAAPFVNTENVSWLAIQDRFPNYRPQFELLNRPDRLDNRIIMAPDTDTIDKIEQMKVGSCLNPLHTTLAVSGVILGYATISEMMKDELIRTWVHHQGYKEALPKAVNPRVILPKSFLYQVLHERLPNENIIDTPQRIATDTSQKIAPRYGGTIKAYGAEAANLIFIPLAIAMYCRYLANATERDGRFYGVNDNLQEVQLSPDPKMAELARHTNRLDPRRAPALDEVKEALRPILSDPKYLGINLSEYGLMEKIAHMAFEMLQGVGSVRSTIQKYVMGK